LAAPNISRAVVSLIDGLLRDIEPARDLFRCLMLEHEIETRTLLVREPCPAHCIF
jgi:hypothetical protein